MAAGVKSRERAHVRLAKDDARRDLEGNILPKLTIIIPVYNEQSTIEAVLDRIETVDVPYEKEVIIVDDGSNDETRAVLALRISEKRAHPWEQVHHSPINLGKGAAIRIGMQHASGDLILIQDADLELDPGEYPLLLNALEEGPNDVVYGVRDFWGTKGGKFRSKLGNYALSLVTSALYGTWVTDMETAYKLFRRPVIDKIRLRGVGFDFEPEVTAKLLRLGYGITEVPITYNPRDVKEGKKIRWSDGVEALFCLAKHRITPMNEIVNAPKKAELAED